MAPVSPGILKALLLAQAMHGSIVGTAWDAETSEPIVGVIVRVGDLGRVAATDDHGRYEIRDVPSGRHRIFVRSMGYAEQSLDAIVPRNAPVEIDVSLLPRPLPLDALDVAATVIVRGVGTGDAAGLRDREVSAAAMRSYPVSAEPDAFEALGGGDVSLRLESPSGVNIQGGSSDQTGYLLDGIPILNPFHSVGLFGAWNPDALARARVATTVSDDAPSGTLAGAIEATTRAADGRLGGQGSVSTAQSRLTFDGPLGPAATGVRFLASLRSGLPDALAPKPERSYLRGETGDWLAKVDGPVLGGRLEILGYGNENDINAAANALPDGETGGPTSRNVFEWSSRSTGARWERRFSSVAVRAIGWRAEAGVGSRWAARAGGMDLAATRRDAGLLADVERRSSRDVTAVQVRVENIRTGYRIVADSAQSWAVDAGTRAATLSARHRRSLARTVAVEAKSTLVTAADRGHFGPGAGLEWAPSEWVRLRAGVARSHQIAQSLRNAESVVGNIFPADIWMSGGSAGGVPNIPISRSDLAEFGVSFAPRPGARVGMRAFARRAEGLVLVAPREGEPFATTRDAFVVGSGASRGLALEGAWSGRRCGVVLSYGLQRVRLSADGNVYAPSFGGTHQFEGGLIFKPGASTSVRLGVAAALGRRATAVSGGFEWEASNLLDRGSEFGGSPSTAGERLGATTLPDYWRVDLAARKQWRIGAGSRDATIAVFGTATNLLGRKNLLTYDRDPATGRRTGVEMRPLSPLVFGLEWGF